MFHFKQTNKQTNKQLSRREGGKDENQREGGEGDDSLLMMVGVGLVGVWIRTYLKRFGKDDEMNLCYVNKQTNFKQTIGFTGDFFIIIIASSLSKLMRIPA